MAEVFDKRGGSLPQNRGELFRQDFQQRYKHLKGGEASEDFDLLSDLIQLLAAHMMQGKNGEPTNFLLSLPQAEARKQIEAFLKERAESSQWSRAAQYLQDLLNFYLLQVSSQPDHIEFHHQLFQEYYAAGVVADKMA